MFGKKCAVCCCTLSVFGILVLTVMGSMISAGDPYIGGHHLVATKADRDLRANACYNAVFIYVVCLALSGVCWMRGDPAKESED
mmetsp:Transcript_8485/g.13369  ORF Transcript_8485/g.13369 Transcript_8485/m.13369 type:complete len:84 (-) Transcript_8485:255-506(-)